MNTSKYFFQTLVVVIVSGLSFLAFKTFLPKKLFAESTFSSKNVVVDSLLLEAIAEDEGATVEDSIPVGCLCGRTELHDPDQLHNSGGTAAGRRSAERDRAVLQRIGVGQRPLAGAQLLDKADLEPGHALIAIMHRLPVGGRGLRGQPLPVPAGWPCRYP